MSQFSCPHLAPSFFSFAGSALSHWAQVLLSPVGETGKTMSNRSKDLPGAEEQTSLLETRLEELREVVSSLKRRVTLLEGKQQQEARLPSSGATLAAESEANVRGSPVALFGRSLVALGGAFFLRMLAENGTLVHPSGFILGLLYASFWILFAHRAADRDRPADAAAYGITACVIGYPLLWETSASYGVSTIAPAAFSLSVFTALLFWVVWRHELRLLAWTVITFVVVVDFGLFFQSRELVPVVTQLAVTAGLVMWTSYCHEWRGPPWLVALAADFLVAVACVVVLLEHPEWLTLGQVLFSQILLVTLFSVTFSVRHLIMARRVQLFEMAQLGAVFLVGVEGAAQVSRSMGTTPLVGIAVLAIGVIAYLVAFWVAARRDVESSTFLLYSTVGAFALVEGLRLTASPGFSAFCLLLLALVAAWLGRRQKTFALRLHAGAFVVVGAIAAGLGTALGKALVTVGAGEEVEHLGAAHGLALCLLVGCYIILHRWRPSSVNERLSELPEIVILFVVIAGIASVILGVIGGPIAGPAGEEAGFESRLAVLRTAVLMVAACSVAVWAVFPGYQHLRVLAWVFVALGAIKLAVVDIPGGSSGTLFLSLVFFGTCLVVVARLGGSRREASSGSGENSPPFGDDDSGEII